MLVAGYAGSGKSEFSRRIAEGLSWPLIDKDSATRPLVDALIGRLTGNKNDRESPTYLSLVRPLEYQTLVEILIDNVRAGLSIIANAPFLLELANPQWVLGLRNTLKVHGAGLRIVWVDCDPEMMHARILQRGASRDTWKLANWDDYIAGVDSTVLRTVADDFVDNSLESWNPLDQSAAKFVASVAAAPSAVKALHW